MPGEPLVTKAAPAAVAALQHSHGAIQPRLRHRFELPLPRMDAPRPSPPVAQDLTCIPLAPRQQAAAPPLLCSLRSWEATSACLRRVGGLGRLGQPRPALRALPQLQPRPQASPTRCRPLVPRYCLFSIEF